jgi:hypothetical protein
MTNPSHLKVRYLFELPELPPGEVENSWTYSYVPNGPDKDYKVFLPTLIAEAVDDVSADILQTAADYTDQETANALSAANLYTDGAVDDVRQDLLSEEYSLGTAMVQYKLPDNGAEGRLLRDKLSDTFSAKDFGAVGDGTTDDTAAIQAAIDAAVLYGKRLHIPAGVYLLTGELLARSNSYIYGDGIGRTVLKLDDTVDWRTNVITIGGSGVSDGVTDVYVGDMTLDSNWPVRSVSAVEGSGTYSGSGLLIQSSDKVTVERVRVIGAYRHGIDITGNAYTSGGSPIGYVTRPSSNVTLRDCEVEGAGDDNITTHQSRNILIDGCYSHDPSGHYVPGNSNCFEIDDGSRHVTVNNCRAMGGSAGLEIKGHADAPAPYDVKVNNFTAINCVEGVVAYHAGHTGHNGEPYSATAHGLEFNNISIIAPCLRSTYANPGGITQARAGMSISAYRGVSITNLLIADSQYGDPAGEFEPSEHFTDFPLAFRNGARQVSVKNVSIMGLFVTDGDSSTVGAVTIQHASTNNIIIDGFNLYNYGGRAGYVTTAAGFVRFANWSLVRDIGDYTAASCVFMGANRGEIINLNFAGYQSGPSFGSTAAPWDSWGVGSPEGVVNGKEGSTYRNLSGGISTSLYVKTSGGVGNTGWTAK